MAGLSRSKVPKIPRQSKIPKTTVPVILFSATVPVALARRAAWLSKKSTANNQYQGPTPIQTIKSKYQQKHKYQHQIRINIMAFQAKSNALENKNICTFKMAIYNKENKH